MDVQNHEICFMKTSDTVMTASLSHILVSVSSSCQSSFDPSQLGTNLFFRSRPFFKKNKKQLSKTSGVNMK